MLMKKTYSPKLAEIERRWYVVDADGIPLGRLASVIATRLRGKHKPTFAPHIDTGDFVIVLNAENGAIVCRFDTELPVATPTVDVQAIHRGSPGWR